MAMKRTLAALLCLTAMVTGCTTAPFRGAVDCLTSETDSTKPFVKTASAVDYDAELKRANLEAPYFEMTWNGNPVQ
jgi:hypothetical protein